MDDIYRRVPVNKTAAVVVGAGFQYTPSKKIACVHSDTPLPINPKKGFAYRGIRNGRLVVLGYSKDIKKRLVVRCDCGAYTIRSLRAMLNEDNVDDCCEMCRHTKFLKRRAEFIQYGKNTD